MSRKHVLIALKLVISGGFLWWVLGQVDGQAFRAVFAQADPLLLLLAYALHVGVFALLWIRYWIMLTALHPGFTPWSIAGSYYAGLFANNFLPTGVGGDLIRSWRLARRGVGWDRLLSSSLVDRTLGLLSIVGFGLFGLSLSDRFGVDGASRHVIYGILAMIPLALLVMFSPTCHRWLRWLFGPWIRFRVIAFGFSLLEQCARYRQHPFRVMLAISLTIILQALTVLCYAALGFALGVELAVVDYFAMVPIVLMTANLPISVGGIGLREGAMTAMLLQYGVGHSTAAAVSLAYLAVLMTLSLPGGLVLLRSNVRLADAEASAHQQQTPPPPS